MKEDPLNTDINRNLLELLADRPARQMDHFPLSKAGVCLDCDAVFSSTASDGCPACGARTVALLASWVKPMKHEISLAREILSPSVEHIRAALDAGKISRNQARRLLGLEAPPEPLQLAKAEPR
jgi:hypothetical protein